MRAAGFDSGPVGASRASARGAWKNHDADSLTRSQSEGKPRAKPAGFPRGRNPERGARRCAQAFTQCGQRSLSAGAGTVLGSACPAKSSGFARDFPHFSFYVRLSAA